VVRIRTGVLISGRGSNLRALVEAARRPDYPADIALVVSNEPAAPGLARAAEAGIATATIDHRAHPTRAAFEDSLTGALVDARIELVALAGFMRVLGGGFVERWRDRLINIHPSLLPAFPGLDTHARALAAGVKLHGCSVHFVREAVDHGPIIGQAAVPVLPDDRPETLAARVLAAEHRLYPVCLGLLAEGRLRVAGELARIEGATAPGGLLVNPPA
jgi:phosphoribosylglycinamide formyltransferase-1